ncbi:MAG: hypothetical protein ACRDZ4_22010 [Egibacteraceae bacterium]
MVAAWTTRHWTITRKRCYGSRCVRPLVIYGDVQRLGPMTLVEAKHAQAFTDQPVKGMLTGPVTTLEWSFVREDVPREQVAYQIAVAIREEARDLENKAKLRRCHQYGERTQ